MNKNELISAVAEKTGLTKKDTEAVISATFEAITEGLVAGEKVNVVGFGIFDVKTRAERTGHNPRTGEAISIPATRLPQFKPGKTLKEAVAK
ncbi:MAG TPA: HU family DNA-binding protein [Candidatus Scatomorpha pullicola]|nr:HU family DNA-binding protein [Candidatus Scatomorpha pullicola]